MDKLPTQYDSIEAGHVMAFTYFGRVSDKSDSRNEITLIDMDHGNPFRVDGLPLITTSFSAHAYSETRKITRTEMAQILTTAWNVPFRVVFEKDDGTERTLIGRLLSVEDLMGRSRVEDLEVPRGENRIRQVNHRGLKSLTVGGIMYVLKN